MSEESEGSIANPLETYGIYRCPTCKGELEQSDLGLRCHVCAVTYPILDRVLDFILEDLAESSNRSLRSIGKLDSSIWFKLAARTYETCVYPMVCNLLGGWRSSSLKKLAGEISGIVGSADGVILDAACGPGTYGRRVASKSRVIYGIDASMSMLRRGVRYVERDDVPNVHFARAKVEALPFQAGLFDAAICAGSLNHFSDTAFALREIGRTMKGGAPLAVMCFAVSNWSEVKQGLFKYRRIRGRYLKSPTEGGGRIFEFPELDRYVAEAGFEGFRPHAYGSIVVFSALKR
jgi:ubiquinone/menaquinone biosynthesis C-methylase UbiE